MFASNISPLPITPGFKLIFQFTPNDFFDNTILEKTYLYQEEVGYAGDFVYDRAIGTEIKWKEDKDLTKEFEVKKQRNKSESISAVISLLPLLIRETRSLTQDTNRTRLVRKAKPTASFFNFFSPPQPPSDEAIENGDLEEDELEELEEKLEIDYQLGEDLKEKVRRNSRNLASRKILSADALLISDCSPCDRLVYRQGPGV